MKSKDTYADISPSLNVTPLKAPVYEVFFSYQGEGPYAGAAQIFARFAGCNLKCGYCDTAYSIKVSPKVKYYTSNELLKIINDKKKAAQNGDKDKSNVNLPLAHPRSELCRLDCVSLTGGEQLIHIDFLKDFLPKLKKSGFRVYLETNATLPENLTAVVKYCDIISMDFKFPSECGRSFWKEHKEFLKIAKNKTLRETFVKCVITKKTTKDEISKSAAIIKSVSKNIRLILQPSLDKNRPLLQSLRFFYSEASKELPYVHLMPQFHKIYKIR